ncbi:MAG: hypothetical protein ACYC4R_00770 [Anaerolineae bacterium]
MARSTDASRLAPDRFVLEGVPRLGFYEGGPRCPEDIILPSALRVYMEYLGDPMVGCHALRSVAREPDWVLDCTYAFLAVVSGMAFQQLWRPGAWEWSEDPLHLGPDPLKPLRRTIGATGYAYEVVGNRDSWVAADLPESAIQTWAGEEEMRERIVASLCDKQRPVLAQGVVGPPECCVVAGYDQGGRALLGWNCFQAMPEFNAHVTIEPNGYFRKEDWYPNTLAIVLMGEKGQRPPQSESLRDALAWAVEMAHTPRVGECYAGLAALSAWAQAMEDDSAFHTDDMDVLRPRYMRHTFTVGSVAEGRWYASLALARVTNYMVGPAPELLAASSCYARMHELMWAIWNCAGGIGEDDDKVRQGTRPHARHQIAAYIREARDCDAQAIAQVEKALTKWE